MQRRLDEALRRAVIVLAAVLGLSCTGCVYARIVYFNFPSLAAPDYFDNRRIAPSPRPAPLRRDEAEVELKVPLRDRDSYRSFDELLEANDTRAFVVVHDDRVVYERYFDNVSESTLLPGFSVTKTYAALLVGCAIEDGMIPSVDARVTSLLPELAAKPGYDEITVDYLLRMVSGIDFDEESTAGAALYYTTDLRGHTFDYDVKWAPGTHYLYGSVNIQLLWEALQRRLGAQTVSKYFERRVWARLGAERSAEWSLDSAESGVEKFFGGFSATARDHARIGLLYLHGGAFDDREVVPRAWVQRSVAPDPVAGVVHTTDGAVRRGLYQWFLTLDGRAYFAKGYHGQYIFVVPDKNVVIVRFGEGYGDVDWVELFMHIADGLKSTSTAVEVHAQSAERGR